MNLYFNIGPKSWICVRDCIDWNDAINNRLSKWWDLRNVLCLNEEEFNKVKENVVLNI